MREAVVADTREEALAIGREYLHRSYLREYGTDDWSHPLVSTESVGDFEAVAEDRFLVGTAAEIADQVDAIGERVPVDHLAVRLHHSGMGNDVLREQIELFGDEVIPEFA